MDKYNATFLVGNPGSGKDFVLRTALKESGATEVPMTKLVNAILASENIDEIDGRPLIINGNADDGQAVLLSKDVLESMGYTTCLIHVYTSDDVSISRSKINEDKRSLRYQLSTENMYYYKDIFGEGFFLFDNSSDFTSVDESTQTQIILWLQELTEAVEKRFKKNKPTPVADQDDTQSDGTGLKEEVDLLFEKEFPTIVDMIAQKKVKGVSQGDKYKGGISVAGNKATSREVVESNQEIKVPQTQAKGVKFNKKNPAKGAKAPGDYFDGRMGAVPSGGVGLTAYKEEAQPKTLKQLREKKDE